MCHRYKLLYPASFLPHKNHYLLNTPSLISCLELLNISVLITTSDLDFSPSSPNVSAIGRLPYDQIIRLYKKSDGLIFLSSMESLGLPLLEAVRYGLPVIAPSLPYAQEILGNSFYSFDFSKPSSIEASILRLSDDLSVSMPLRPVVNINPINSTMLLDNISSGIYS